MTRWLASRNLCAVMFAVVASPVLVDGEAQKTTPWAVPRGWRPQSPPEVRAPDVPGPILFSEPEFPLGATVNGLTITTLNGAPIGATTTFSYTVGGSPSTDSTIAGGPPTQMFVDPPGIEGGTAASELGANFGQDVDRVGFGWAMNCGQSPPPSVTVTLLDSVGGTVATATVPGSMTGFPFAEGQVFMDPVLVFRSMRVTFNNPGACDRFFLDNLGYPPLVTPVEAQGFTVE